MAAPTFHAIVMVDIESFGPRRNPVQVSLRQSMYETVQQACEDAHIEWDDVVIVDRDDGIMLLVPPATSMVDIAGRFVRALDANLAEKARMFSEAHRMRFRVALHQGLCHRDGNGWTGAAITAARRLADAGTTRRTLAAAPEARMVLIVSDDVYQSVISHEYRLIDAASFASVAADGEKAWISVPGRPYPPLETEPAGTDPAGTQQPGGEPAGPHEPAGPQELAGPKERAGAQPAGADTASHPHRHGGIDIQGNVTVHGDQIAGDKYEGRRP